MQFLRMLVIAAGLSYFSPGLCEEGSEVKVGILSPYRIDMVEFSYDRDWSFLPHDKLSAARIYSGCGVRFIEGKFFKNGKATKVQLLEFLGEFCEEISELKLRGSYVVVAKRSRGKWWITNASKVYLWEDGMVTVPLDSWIDELDIKGTKIECNKVVVGPFGATNTEDMRTCFTFAQGAL